MTKLILFLLLLGAFPVHASDAPERSQCPAAAVRQELACLNRNFLTLLANERERTETISARVEAHIKQTRNVEVLRSYLEVVKYRGTIDPVSYWQAIGNFMAEIANIRPKMLLDAMLALDPATQEKVVQIYMPTDDTPNANRNISALQQVPKYEKIARQLVGAK
jgi:hypothetical protein